MVVKNKKFWIWKNQIENENKVRVLSINGTIAEDSWFDDDVTPKLFKEELFSDDGDVVIWLNSPGGDCIAASQIYSMLMDYPFNITVKIDGIAASAASVIAMAGTKVLLAPTALMMIHNPMTVAFGNHEDMKKAIDMLNQVKESIINAYELKTNQPRSKLSKLMDSETWMNANKAIELGFADGLLEDSKKTRVEDSYSYSGKNIESKLINKITNKYKKTSQEKVETGVSINELEKRLFLIKP
ncbi:MAG: Clp protease ClpP [Sphaerochaetaceae bacterium]|nr:Clp protease ClpP [Sphaerochaetaceae bacterium]